MNTKTYSAKTVYRMRALFIKRLAVKIQKKFGLRLLQHADKTMSCTWLQLQCHNVFKKQAELPPICCRSDAAADICNIISPKF